VGFVDVNLVAVYVCGNMNNAQGKACEGGLYLDHLVYCRVVQVRSHCEEVTGLSLGCLASRSYYPDRNMVPPSVTLRCYMAGLNPVTSPIREGFEGPCARQKCSTCPGDHDICCAGLCLYCVFIFWFCFLYVHTYVSVFNFSELVCDLLPRRLFDSFC